MAELHPTMMHAISAIFAAALAASSLPASACADHAPGKEPKARSAAKTTPFVAGQIREVDVEEGTVTLAHGAIPSLRMQAMSSMMLEAADAGAIARLNPGDRVRFRVRMAGEQPTLVAIELTGK